MAKMASSHDATSPCDLLQGLVLVASPRDKSHRVCRPLSFGSWGNFKVLTLDFEWFPSEVHCELATKTV